ncbi:MAG TPA: MFS transporter [Kofleriaceae bacterium]|nr:MFS transporter [Kofleriaceae bacterium]
MVGPRLLRPRLPEMGRALRHRNYRLFFAGQGISMVGTWMTRVATSWLVYRLTGSALLLGLVSFAGQVPSFLLAPFAGVLIDRWNRHRILVATQAVAMVQSALLAYFALSGTITVAHVLALSVLQGVVNAFDMPARQSFVVEMVETREDLPNAIALNSSLVNGARLIGPSIGGILIAAVGEGWCFTIDAISYVAVIASLLAMTVKPRARAVSTKRVLAELREGAAYVFSFSPIRTILLLLALISFMGVPYSVLTPIFAAEVLGGGPHTLGLLMGSSGVGALAGALWLASRRTVVGLGRVLVMTSSLLGAGLIVYALSRWLWLSVPALLMIGAGMMVSLGASNTILQTVVDEDKRGRVMGFYAMSFFGMAPFGSLAAGALADRFGAPTTVLLCGAATLIGAAGFARTLPELRRVVRPIYQRLGILPAIAEGLHQTSAMSAAAEE